MKKTIRPVKGTTDFYPAEMAVRTWLYEKIRSASEAFGYEEFEAPILESIELYAAKSGEEIVNEQAFVFPDRSGEMITLRPELTPSLARMIAQRQHSLAYPVRWWSFGPMWRYERPQKGRTREFFQWNIDLIGIDTPEADAEIAAIGAEFLRLVGLTPEQTKLRVNSRKLVESELLQLGISRDLSQKTIQLIDRVEKMRPEVWEQTGLDLGLSPTQISEIKKFVRDDNLWKKSEELQAFFTASEILGSREFLEFSPSTVRGLNYYTGIIFECFDIQGSYRSIFAGGRYDNLVEDVGGEPLAAVGFAMGDKVIQVVLEEYGLLPDASQFTRMDIFVSTFSAETLPNSLALAAEVRKAGWNVATYPSPAKLGKQLKFASKSGARLAIILGPDEIEQDQVMIRDMEDRSQMSVSHTDLIEAIARILALKNPS